MGLNEKSETHPLRVFLKSSGMSIFQAASRMKLGSTGTVHSWFTGLSFPTPGHVTEMAALLGIPRDEMLARLLAWKGKPDEEIKS